MKWTRSFFILKETALSAEQSQVLNVLAAPAFRIGRDRVDLKMSCLVAPHAMGTFVAALVIVDFLDGLFCLGLDITRVLFYLGVPTQINVQIKTYFVDGKNKLIDGTLPKISRDKRIPPFLSPSP